MPYDQETPSEGDSGLPRVRISNVMVHAADEGGVRSKLSEFLETRRPRQVVTVNVDFLQQASSSSGFCRVLNEADLAVMDGQPLVWLARHLGLRCERVTGPQLIRIFCELSELYGYRLFLLGAEEGVAETARQTLLASYPRAVISGAYSPPNAPYPFPEEVDRRIAECIREARPDILIVAFGCPKQDYWIHDHLNELAVPVSVGVGASLDYLAGRVGRAPAGFQQLGIEWLYRLYREPRRLWKRYLRNDMPFFLQLIALHCLAQLRIVRRPVLEVVTRGS